MKTKNKYTECIVNAYWLEREIDYPGLDTSYGVLLISVGSIRYLKVISFHTLGRL